MNNIFEVNFSQIIYDQYYDVIEDVDFYDNCPICHTDGAKTDMKQSINNCIKNGETFKCISCGSSFKILSHNECNDVETTIECIENK